MTLKLTQTGTSILALMTLAALVPIANASADANVDTPDVGYYTIANVETHEIPTAQTQQAQPMDHSAGALDLATPQPSDGSGNIDISDIVNIGKQLWDIVQADQPVANVTTSSASIVPQGITNWEQLADWQAPQTKTYESSFKNLYGITVIDFQFRISYTPGGSYNGKGQYLANVTVEPQNVSVLWGYKFNAQVTIPSITNAGTQQSPVAAADVVVQWTVDTILKHDEQSSEYYVRGDGQFEAL